MQVRQLASSVRCWTRARPRRAPCVQELDSTPDDGHANRNRYECLARRARTRRSRSRESTHSPASSTRTYASPFPTPRLDAPDSLPRDLRNGLARHVAARLNEGRVSHVAVSARHGMRRQRLHPPFDNTSLAPGVRISPRKRKYGCPRFALSSIYATAATSRTANATRGSQHQHECQRLCMTHSRPSSARLASVDANDGEPLRAAPARESQRSQPEGQCRRA